MVRALSSTLGPWSMKCRIGDPPGQLAHPTVVVAVVVGRDQIIDLLQSGLFDRSHDPANIPVGVRPAVAGVDQQRLACRRDEEGRVASLYVDQIDL